MSSWRDWHRPLVCLSAVTAVLAVVSTAGLVLDDRVLVGSPIWLKPWKFSVSFTAYCMTLAWMLSLLPRGRRAVWWAGTVVAVASAVEMAVITGQVIRGRRSHFNQETAFDAMLFNVMGMTIVVLWGATVVIAVALWRSGTADRAGTWAIRLGTVLALAGAGLGFLMTLPVPGQVRPDDTVSGAHSVGVVDGGPSMPLTGWATTGGDLRVPHFVGMHALQLLPLLLVLLAALAPRLPRLRDPRVRLRLVLTASGAYAAVLALLTWQALRGQPLIHPDGATLGAAALILVGAAAGTAAALRPNRPAPEAAGNDKELVA
ncbi:hypothetical protein [Streptomyces sp. Ru87]|uniref:hypothetical protein n=1 Tax=Streptomyces sp. Ru87 TaxID=2044307 RepID=UPI000BFA90BE|nr:hypothetical protein [Streptomyces sp. Ru87]PGH47033.1 hypothetical protein CRI70_30765 [Streptomyces sp. Ru87]